ncbi:MAG: hypothetical protein R3243_15460 [Arenibacter latericius]|nr:hypothetical protein [Arenibacter latericius]
MRIVHFKSFEEKKFRQLVRTVQKKIKKVFKIPVLGKTQKQKDILLDVIKMFPLADLVEYLAKENFKTQQEYIDSVNAWLELEKLSFNYSFDLKYEIGKISDTVTLILQHHKIIDSVEEILNS